MWKLHGLMFYCAPMLIGLIGCEGGRPPAEAPAVYQDASRTQFSVAPATPPSGAVAEEISINETAVEDSEFNREGYDHIVDNAFLNARKNPLSTFSIDVDTASYSNVRRFLQQQRRSPPKGAVRIEELINYFRYDYAGPDDETPFAVNSEVAACPWNPEHRLLRLALKGREVVSEKRPASNLVFLVDTSGSMNSPDKLPLLQQALGLLAEQLTENDRVALTAYAGAAGLVLPSTSGSEKARIQSSLNSLRSGGSTNGGQGIQLAYEVARQNFIANGVNRVILCTDGDFNVGLTSRDSLVELIEEQAKSGVFLSVLGFGTGNYQDGQMEALADKGNGNYAYIDTLKEAQKVLVEQMSGTLITIAKDVKIQIEFNPAVASAYRLIGYENRVLKSEDFNDDKKDAGEIGAGHTVTALYEIVPAGSIHTVSSVDTGSVDPLEFQQPGELTSAAAKGALLKLKLRYKEPDGDRSKLLQFYVQDSQADYAKASPDYKFAAAVAAFGMLLRDSPHRGNATFAAVHELANEGLGPDLEGYRKEFLDLVKQAELLQPRK